MRVKMRDKNLSDQMSQRSLGSLCNAVKALIVSLVRQTDRQTEGPRDGQ